MGLDMFLEARKYISSWDEDGKQLRKEISRNFPETDGKEIKSVTCELIYWRKANAIHKWFVDNCQDGRDECQDTYIEVEKLEELLNVVTEALSSKDPSEILPTQSGFFFGNTEYDEYYTQDLEFTIAELEKILANKELIDNWDLYYCSSW